MSNPHEKRRMFFTRRILVITVLAALSLPLVPFLILKFVVGTFHIPSGAMKPTLQPGDTVVVNRLHYVLSKPRRGDIVILEPPPEAHSGGKNYIKRIIALPGETVEMREGRVLIDDKPLREDYIGPGQTPDYGVTRSTVPPDGVFVLGDNRRNSQDSHIWGPLPIRNLRGKMLFLFRPPGQGEEES